jgi:hypothetical protein
VSVNRQFFRRPGHKRMVIPNAEKGFRLFCHLFYAT